MCGPCGFVSRVGREYWSGKVKSSTYLFLCSAGPLDPLDGVGTGRLQKGGLIVLIALEAPRRSLMERLVELVV